MNKDLTRYGYELLENEDNFKDADDVLVISDDEDYEKIWEISSTSSEEDVYYDDSWDMSVNSDEDVVNVPSSSNMDKLQQKLT